MARPRIENSVPKISLKTTPIQSDTYAPPPKPPAGNPMADLAASLGPLMKGFDMLAAQQKDKQSDEQRAAAQGKIAGLTRAQATQLVNSGEIPEYDDPWAQKTVTKGVHYKAGKDFAALTSEDMQKNFDWENGDAEAEVTGRLNAKLEELGIKDPAAMSGFVSGFGNVSGWASGVQHKRKMDRFEEERRTVAWTTLSGVIEESPADEDPETTAGKVISSLTALGPGSPLNMSKEQVEAELVNAIGNISAQRPEVALALLSKKLPNGRSLSQMRQYEGQVRIIRETANKAQVERRKLEAEATQEEQDWKQALDGKKRLYIEDKTVSIKGAKDPIVLTSKKRSAKVVERWNTQMDMLEGERKLTPQQRTSEDIGFYARNGLQNQRWKQRFDNVLASVNDTSLQNEDTQQQVIADYELYREISGTAPHLLDKHMDAPTKEFFETVDVAMDVKGERDVVGGMLAAYQASKFGIADPFAGHKDRLKDTLDELYSDTGMSSRMPVRNRYERAAALYINMGMDPKDALEKADEKIRATMTEVNGMLHSKIPDWADDDFTETAELIIDRWYERFGEKQGIDKDDIGLAQGDGGRWILMDHASVSPLRDDNGRIVEYSKRNFEGFREAIEYEKRSDRVLENSKKYDPWIYGTWGWIRPTSNADLPLVKARVKDLQDADRLEVEKRSRTWELSEKRRKEREHKKRAKEKSRSRNLWNYNPNTGVYED